MYLSVAFYLDRDDVTPEPFRRCFRSQWHEKREQARKPIMLQNLRGGLICLPDIRKPEREYRESGLEATEWACHLEEGVGYSLLELHYLAMEKGDAQLCDCLQSHFLNQQVKAVRELGGYLSHLHKMWATGNRPGRVAV